MNEAEKQATDSIQRFHAQAFSKFMSGQEEHGGDFASKFTSLEYIQNAKQEVIDLWFYLDFLEQKLK